MLVESLKEVVASGKPMKDCDSRQLAQTCVEAFTAGNRPREPTRDPIGAEAATRHGSGFISSSSSENGGGVASGFSTAGNGGRRVDEGDGGRGGGGEGGRVGDTSVGEIAGGGGGGGGSGGRGSGPDNNSSANDPNLGLITANQHQANHIQ